MLLTYKESCPGLDVAVMAVQVVDGLGQVDAELLLAVGHLARGEPACHCQGPQGLSASTPASLTSLGRRVRGVCVCVRACSYLRSPLLTPGPSPGRSRGSGGR